MDDEALRLVWQWIIDHNDHSYTVDDLIHDLERAGHHCPADLED